MYSLADIVRDRNLAALERLALSRTHRQLMEMADVEGVDRGELEELLWEIS